VNIFQNLQRIILDALQPHSRPSGRVKHVYQGTANPKAVARRRAKNKVARRSRAINRHR
jgi:hypothetical protein